MWARVGNCHLSVTSEKSSLEWCLKIVRWLPEKEGKQVGAEALRGRDNSEFKGGEGDCKPSSQAESIKNLMNLPRTLCTTQAARRVHKALLDCKAKLFPSYFISCLLQDVSLAFWP